MARQTALDARSPHHFTGTSPRIQPDRPSPAMPAGASSAACRCLARWPPSTPRCSRHAVRFGCHDVSTPAREAFALRHGVCQDFSHIMITALRALGIPAGYVSGLLRTRPPKGQPRLEGADAMHAWVMAWCGEEAGWVEFDPTNGVRVANDHVVIAHGRDYATSRPSPSFDDQWPAAHGPGGRPHRARTLSGISVRARSRPGWRSRPR